MLQQGIVMIMWGSIMPELIIEFSLSEAAAGTVLGLGAFGFLFGPLMSGPAIDRTGLRLILLMGLVGEFIFLFILGVSQWFRMLVLTAFMINLGCGFIQRSIYWLGDERWMAHRNSGYQERGQRNNGVGCQNR